MAKQVVAVTRVKVQDELITPGSVIDVKAHKLTEKQLIRLHETGAVKLEDVPEAPEAPEKSEDSTEGTIQPEENKTSSGPAEVTVIEPAASGTKTETTGGQSGKSNDSGNSGVAGTSKASTSKSK